MTAWTEGSQWDVTLEMLEPDQTAACCLRCGRQYHDLSAREVTRMTQGITGCPSDDCPGHWEDQGREYPYA